MPLTNCMLTMTSMEDYINSLTTAFNKWPQFREEDLGQNVLSPKKKKKRDREEMFQNGTSTEMPFWFAENLLSSLLIA